MTLPSRQVREVGVEVAEGVAVFKPPLKALLVCSVMHSAQFQTLVDNHVRLHNACPMQVPCKAVQIVGKHTNTGAKA